MYIYTKSRVPRIVTFGGPPWGDLSLYRQRQECEKCRNSWKWLDGSKLRYVVVAVVIIVVYFRVQGNLCSFHNYTFFSVFFGLVEN